MSPPEWDAVVVGGGPAGLSGALWLARYRRRVLTIDGGSPRNEPAWAVHGFPGVEDPAPAGLRDRIRAQASRAGAQHERGRVQAITGEKGSFVLERDDGSRTAARRVLLAYGRQDRVPDLPGLAPLYGSSVFHCPDCDGPSVAGEAVAVLGHDRAAAALALFLLTWADRTILLTNGLQPDLDPSARATLQRHGVAVETGSVQRLEGSDGRLSAALLEDRRIPLGALFFHWGSDPASALGPASGCECDDSGDLRVDSALETSVPGIYAAGDIIGRPHLAISAAAGGVRAALALHRSLLPADFQL